MLLSVIVPAYNEASTIRQLLKLVLAQPIDLELVVVDDGSTDGTTDILREFAADQRVRVITQESNQGKGAAIRTGIAGVRGEIVLIQDADLEYDPGDYTAILEQFEDPDVSVVYGSRLKLKSNHISSPSFFLGGVTLTVITNLLYGTRLTDEPTCYKAFRAPLLKSLPLECKRFEFCPEVTALIAKRGIRIQEVPIHYFPRRTADGKKIRARDWFEAVATLLRYRFRRI